MEDTPPPYSETDIYSNAGSRPPQAPGAYPSSSAHTDTASIASSVLYTPPYTPAEEFEHLESPAQFYFDSRPITYRAVGPTFTHEITIAAHCRFEDFEYEVSFADRDITTQDWATFVNFLVPQHIDGRNEAVASNKMKAELLDERMQRLTVSGEKEGLNMAAVDAQLGTLAPQVRPEEEHYDPASVVQEWNRGFFEPRGVRIVAHLDVDDPPVVLPDDVSEFRRPSAASGDSAGPPLPPRPTFLQARAMSGNDGNTGRKHGRQRDWGWGPHGPAGRHGNRDCGGRGRHCGRGYRTGPMDDNVDGCGGCRRCGPRRARTEEHGAQSHAHTMGGEFAHHGKGFRFGPVVADESGFRIGTVMRANSEGLQLGSMFMGKSPPSEGSEEESEGSTVSEESEGSLPDVDDLTPRQLPVLRQSLMDWLNHPEQPVTKLQMKQLKSNLKLFQADKTVPKPEGSELAKLKSDLKEMKQRFKEAKRERRNASREAKRQRRRKKREDRRARRQERANEKIAQKREMKGKWKATHSSEQAAKEAADAARQAGDFARDTANAAREAAQKQSEQIQQHVRQQVNNGLRGFVPPTGSGHFSNARGPFRPFGRGGGPPWGGMCTPQPPAPPSTPIVVPPIPPMPTPPLPRQQSNNSSRSNLSQHSELQENLSYLRSEATRHISDAETLRASAASMRREAHEGFDEKTRCKMGDAAEDLEIEARRLAEEADRLLAEALQLEIDEGERERREGERMRGEGRSYLRRMRESSGVVV